MDTDRNLLFGVLAVQLEHLSPRHFAEACAAWAIAREGTLAQLLVVRGWLTPEAAEEVERLLQRKLARHQGDAQKSLGHELTADLRQVLLDADQDDLRKTLSCLAKVPDAPQNALPSDALPSDALPSDPSRFGSSRFVPTQTIDMTPEPRSRYTLSRVHGEGGLGRVWLAHDTHLNRDVALKEILPGKERNAITWRRFMREAQITSQLDHPNIVPIYELAGGGVEAMFYTMRFVRGRTLRAAIDEYHQRRQRGEATPREFRELLQAFVAVCHAVGFAHSRGVLHRDLKPMNIMLGAFGEVVVLDWGLAKVIDAPDDDVELQPVAVTDQAAVDATQAGTVLGSLRYMAPEQAAGRVDLFDVRTDVYGLGSILFTILTGNHPHRGQTTQAVRSHILSEPTPHARAEDSTVASALDAVCAKAMAKERADRYAKARDLADDVLRWLADEPVSAYREPWTDRLSRWQRRHRTWTQAIAAALLLVTLAAVVSVVVVERSRRAEVQARQAEADARQAESSAKSEATRRLRQTRDVLESSLTQMSRELVHYPGVQPLREMLLQRATAEYERFAAEASDERDLQVESALAFLRLGEVQQLRGKQTEAAQAFAAAADKLARVVPEDDEIRLRRAQALRLRANALAATGDSGGGRAALAEALKRLTGAPAESVAARWTLRLESARCRVEDARIAARLGDLRSATESLEMATAMLELFVRRDDRVEHLQSFAEALLALAEVQQSSGEHEASVRSIRAATEVYERLLQRDANHPDFYEGRAVAAIQLARAVRRQGQIAEELQAWRMAGDSYTALVRARPEIAQYRENQAVIWSGLAQLLHELGDNDEARQYADEACGGFTYLINHHPPLPRYYEALAVASLTLGQASAALGRDDDAERHFDGAIRLFEEVLLPRAPQQPTHERGLGIACSNFGRLRQKQGHVTAARRLFEEALAHYDAATALMTDPATDHATASVRAWTLRHLAELLWESGQPAAAREQYAAALATLERLPDDADRSHALARLLSERLDVESRDLDRAAQLADALCRQAPDNPRYWHTAALVRYRSSNWSEAERLLAEAAKRRWRENAADLLVRAMCRWQAGRLEEARGHAIAARSASHFAENVGHLDFQRLRDEVVELLAE